MSFSASAYAEGENVYGSDIVVEAIEGAEFGTNNVVSKKGTVVASKVVDISSAVGRFETFTVTLDGLSPTSRIAFPRTPHRRAPTRPATCSTTSSWFTTVRPGWRNSPFRRT